MLVGSQLFAVDTISLDMRTTSIYTLVLLCGAVFAQSPPSIVVHPTDAIVRQDTTHVLHCTATNAEMPIRWAHNGVVLKLPDDNRQLENNSLRITNVDTSMTGRYACRASNSIGTVTSRQAILRVAWLNGTNQPSMEVVTRLVGESLKLNCGDYTSLPEATVTWSRRDPVIESQQINLGDNVVSSVESGLLYFRSLTASHSGLYVCVVTNALTNSNVMGSYKLEVNDTLVIHPQPDIALAPSNVIVNRGDTASFQCITEGSPLPAITWSRIVKGNNSLSAANIRLIAETSVLHVLNVQPSDVGDYICNPSEGVSQLVAYLRIRDAPVLTSTPADNSQSVKFGDDLQLSCSANGTLPIKLTWFRNGEQLTSTPDGRVSVEPLGQVTVYNTSTSGDSGVYQCYAENEAGFSNFTVLVNVFTVPPSITLGLRDTVVFDGDPLMLKCQADGAPPPQYTWYRGSIVLDGIDRYDTSVPGMLKMKDVGRDQGGTYNCSVSSMDNGVQVGRNSSTARVFVVSPTVFKVTTARQLAEQAGSNITLPCTVTSDKSTTIMYSWMHNGTAVVVDKRVSMNDGSLVISALQSTDAGSYTCVVETRVTDSLNAKPRVLHSNVSILIVSAYPVAPRRPVAVEIGQSSVLLEWLYEGDARQISHFQVDLQQSGDEEWTKVLTVNALATTQVNVTGLFPFTEYQFRVLSVNNNDMSSSSESSESVKTKQAAPTAKPTNIKLIDSNYTAIAIEWEHPPLRLPDGTGRNGIIISYKVIYAPEGGSGNGRKVMLNTKNNVTRLIISGVEQKLVYMVSIAASNSQGTGPAIVVKLPTMGAVTGTEDEDEEFHEQTWFIVVVVIVGLIMVTIIVLMLVCVARSVRRDKSHEGKYNVEGIKDGHITTGVLNKDVVEDYENRRTTHLIKYSLSNEYRSNASLITDNVAVETQSNAASTLPAPPYIPPPSFASLGHCSSLSTIDRPVFSKGANGWNNFVIAESDVFEEACSSVEKVPMESESDECDGKCSSVSTSNKCATFV